MSSADVPPIAKLKDKAREVARQYRKATGGELQHSRALDAVARQYGFDTWATLVATRGAHDAGHANARKVPSVEPDAVAYPSLPALLAAREPAAPLMVTLVVHERPGSSDDAPVAAVFSDFRRGVQRYTAHRVGRIHDGKPWSGKRETAAFTEIRKLLKPLHVPLVVASRQSVAAPLWRRMQALPGPDGERGEALRPEPAAAAGGTGPLAVAEAGWLAEAARLLGVAERWTFGRRDAAGQLRPAIERDGAPLVFASRHAVEAMIQWYAGELGGCEPLRLDASTLDAGAANGQHAPARPMAT